MSDKCPGCEAIARKKFSPDHPIQNYACGTRIVNTGFKQRIERSTRCLEAQISQLQARIAELEELLIRADSMLSLLRHRAALSIKWGTVGLPDRQEVDNIIGLLRSATRKAALES